MKSYKLADITLALLTIALVLFSCSCGTVDLNNIDKEKAQEIIDLFRPTPAPEGETPESPDIEQPPAENVRVIKGVDGRNAQVTKRLTAFQIVNTNLMTYAADSLADWPMQVHNGKNCYGEAQLFVLRDGKWTGGKFDHVHPNGTSRDFKNIVGEHKGYLAITPASGEPVRYRMVSYDGRQKTNMMESVWP